MQPPPLPLHHDTNSNEKHIILIPSFLSFIPVSSSLIQLTFLDHICKLNPTFTSSSIALSELFILSLFGFLSSDHFPLLLLLSSVVSFVISSVHSLICSFVHSIVNSLDHLYGCLFALSFVRLLLFLAWTSVILSFSHSIIGLLILLSSGCSCICYFLHSFDHYFDSYVYLVIPSFFHLFNCNHFFFGIAHSNHRHLDHLILLWTAGNRGRCQKKL